MAELRSHYFAETGLLAKDRNFAGVAPVIVGNDDPEPVVAGRKRRVIERDAEAHVAISIARQMRAVEAKYGLGEYKNFASFRNMVSRVIAKRLSRVMT